MKNDAGTIPKCKLREQVQDIEEMKLFLPSLFIDSGGRGVLNIERRRMHDAISYTNLMHPNYCVPCGPST